MMNYTITTEIEITEKMIEKTWSHVLDIYENDIDNIKHDSQYGIVSGGCMLVYNNDIKKWLCDELDIEIDIKDCFDFYDYIVNTAIAYNID